MKCQGFKGHVNTLVIGINDVLTTSTLDADFATFMAQVDDIHQQAVEIEKVAHALDEYSRHLGNFNGEKVYHHSSSPYIIENKLAKKTNPIKTPSTRSTLT